MPFEFTVAEDVPPVARWPAASGGCSWFDRSRSSELWPCAEVVLLPGSPVATESRPDGRETDEGMSALRVRRWAGALTVAVVGAEASVAAAPELDRSRLRSCPAVCGVFPFALGSLSRSRSRSFSRSRSKLALPARVTFAGWAWRLVRAVTQASRASSLSAQRIWSASWSLSPFVARVVVRTRNAWMYESSPASAAREDWRPIAAF